MNADRYFFPDSAMTCGAHPANDEVVRAMLGEVAANFEPPVSDTPTNSEIVRVICAAARRLGLEGGAFNEALRATLCAPVHLRNNVSIFSSRCMALFRLSAWDDLRAEMDRLYKLPQVRPERDARLLFWATRSGIGWRMTDWTRCPPLLSNPAETVSAAWFCAPLEQGFGGAINPAHLDNLGKLGPFAPHADQMADLQLGATQDVRDKYLWRADGQAREILAAPERYDSKTLQHARHMVDQFDHAVRDMVKGDISPILQALAAGRNAIVLRAHAGVRVIEPLLATAGVPIWNVANHEVEKKGAKTLMVTRGPGFNLGFLKLAKELKRHPQIVVIFPDGGVGAEWRQVDLGPVRANIRLGGAALARVARSTVFFMRSVWTGHGFEMELIKGPDFDAQMTADQVNDQFVAFYADGLRRVIAGAKVDYGLANFSKCFADAAASDDQESDEANT